MSVSPEYEPIARAINQLAGLHDHNFEWWGKMLSSIVIALGPIDPAGLKYMTSVLSGDEYEIALFTGSLLVTGETNPSPDNKDDFTVSVHSLQEISALSVDASSSLFGGIDFSSWPGRMTVKFEHPSAGSISLPYSDKYNNYLDAKLLAFIPELVDLIRARS